MRWSLFPIGCLCFFLSSAQVADSLPVENATDKTVRISLSGDTGKTYLLPGTIPEKTKSDKYSFLRNYDQPFRKKMWRGEKLIGGVEAVGMITLILMPKSITKWQEDWFQDAMRNLKSAFTRPPVWDHDPWAINYIGHPVGGAYYYNAIRSQNATWFQSFLFSFAQSTFWEYVVEGIAEQPSIQDIICTPVGGAILGELTHQMTIAMSKNKFNALEKAAVLVLNPIYVMNNGFNKRLKNRVQY
jgi:hypothetical protein